MKVNDFLIIFFFIFQTQFMITSQLLTSFIGDTSSLITIWDYFLKNDRTTELMEQLDTILSSITSLDRKFDCSVMSSDFDDGKKLMKRLQNSIRNKESHKQKSEVNDHIKKICFHASEGVEKMLVLLEFYLEKKNVLKAIKWCCHYESECVDNWSQFLKYYSVNLVFLVKNCEESSGMLTGLDVDIFLDEIDAKIRYYKKLFLIQEFVKDTGYFGLNQVLQDIGKNISKSRLSGYHVSDFKKELKEKYHFFDWDVVYSFNYQKPEYTVANQIFCGSYVYKYENNWILNDFLKHILFSWCISNEVDKNFNTLIFRNFFLDSDSLKLYLDSINKISKNLNYAFCSSTDNHYINENNSNFFYKPLVTYKHSIYNSKVRCFISNMPVKTPIWFDSLKNVDLTSNSLIFTAKKKQSIEENKKKTLRYTNLRLIGHYLNVNAETPAACWNLCKQDSFRCEAISYATIETRYFATQCFLFDFYSVHNDQNYLTDSFWITYLKADLIMNKKLEKIAPSKILKTCAFNNPCKENFICKDENNFEQKCYLRVKTDLIESTTVTNWGDWNHEEYCPEGTFAIGFNMKLEPYQARDNTAMNGLQLICERNFFIQSGVGGWGTWGIDVYCNNSLYLNGFRLKVEKPQPKQDDTATNSVEFSCADGRIISPLGHWENKNVVWNYGGIWGDWTEWKYCPEKSFICGLQTQIEKTYIWNDDTALNNIKLFCCKIQLESTQN